MGFTEERAIELLFSELKEGVVDKLIDICTDQECRLCLIELGIN